MTHSVTRKQFIKGSCWCRRRFPAKDKAGDPKKHFTNATGDMELTMYLGRPTLVCIYDVSKALSHSPVPVRWRPVLATGGCTGVCRASESTCIVSFRLFSNREKIREDKYTALAVVQATLLKILRVPSGIPLLAIPNRILIGLLGPLRFLSLVPKRPGYSR
ncbi:hypothetical protein KM043_007085 [Ampulex compressa]|nr:hypothetical protein KM043_007085 [Ampulex compressa]